LDGVKQQLGVDLQLPLEHQPLERLASHITELNRDSLAHFPIRRKNRSHVIFEVDQMTFQPIETIVNLKMKRLKMTASYSSFYVNAKIWYSSLFEGVTFLIVHEHRGGVG